MNGRETAKTDEKKDEPEDAVKDDSKEKTPLVEPEKVSRRRRLQLNACITLPIRFYTVR